MTATNWQHVNANRLAALNGILEPLGDKASAEAPELWRERAVLIRAQNERDRLEEKERQEREANNRAARFLPTIEQFRKRAQAFGKSFELDVTGVQKALAGMTELQADYNALWREGTREGATVPTLAELSGIGSQRLERVTLAAHLLTQGNE